MTRPGAFNTGNQSKPSWLERSNLAWDLLADAVAAGEVGSLSDIGCGDEKLKRLLNERGWAVRYQGYDLVPQGAGVRPLDLNSQIPDGHSDAAVALGVLEYVDDVGASLRRLAAHAPMLVVSHTLRESAGIDEAAQHALGWKNHLHSADFVALLSSAGWCIEDERTTSDGRTRLWLARRVPAPA